MHSQEVCTYHDFKAIEQLILSKYPKLGTVCFIIKSSEAFGPITDRYQVRVTSDSPSVASDITLTFLSPNL